MPANAKSTKAILTGLPTMDDLATGKVSLDEYESAHGEDAPELTEDMMARSRPISDFPELATLFERARGQRGPQKAPVKERVGLRLNKDVIDYFRHNGPGWQSRINDVLAEFVKASEK
jgi:uncharacterized protein (DUF4415 family)